MRRGTRAGGDAGDVHGHAGIRQRHRLHGIRYRTSSAGQLGELLGHVLGRHEPGDGAGTDGALLRSGEPVDLVLVGVPGQPCVCGGVPEHLAHRQVAEEARAAAALVVWSVGALFGADTGDAVVCGLAGFGRGDLFGGGHPVDFFLQDAAGFVTLRLGALEFAPNPVTSRLQLGDAVGLLERQVGATVAGRSVEDEFGLAKVALGPVFEGFALGFAGSNKVADGWHGGRSRQQI